MPGCGSTQPLKILVQREDGTSATTSPHLRESAMRRIAIILLCTLVIFKLNLSARIRLNSPRSQPHPIKYYSLTCRDFLCIVI